MPQLKHNLIIRQSLINDILTCPHMATHRWIANKSVGKSDSDGTGNINSTSSSINDAFTEDSKTTYMAAILGTAGHSVIETIHHSNKSTYNYIELYDLFNDAFEAAKKQNPTPIQKSVQHDSEEDEVDAKIDDYIEMIQGYQELQQRNPFYVASSEQQFVFTINYNNNDYLFNGSIDHFGYYTQGDLSGTSCIRDIKFRDRTFKPSLIERQLNLQFTIYAHALKHGVPCCKYCAPYYDQQDHDLYSTTEIYYDGPCDNCSKLIKTNVWPQQYTERCELIWMRDFNKYKRKYGKHKAGDPYGQGVYTVNRSPSTLTAYMNEVMKLVESFCTGLDYRRPGSHCNMWCNYQEECLGLLNMNHIPITQNPDF